MNISVAISNKIDVAEAAAGKVPLPLIQISTIDELEQIVYEELWTIVDESYTNESYSLRG